MTNLALLLKAARRDQRISQTDLAERLGCTQGHISKIEREGGMSAEMLVKLMTWLMEEVKDEYV